MKKKTKDQCILESNLEKWSNEETARLAAKGKDDKFCIVTYSKMNKGTIHGGDYTMKFNRDEGVIDLVINGEEDSLIWDNVISNVPAQFAAVLGNPENFLYRFSTSTSEEKKFYGYVKIDDVSALLPILKFNAIEAWKAENFDSLISFKYFRYEKEK